MSAPRLRSNTSGACTLADLTVHNNVLCFGFVVVHIYIFFYSPAGAAIAEPLTPELEAAYEVQGKTLTPQALAYIRARNADPMSR